MNSLYPDLFPETLLVNIADGQAYTTSRKIAKHFRKQHRDVLKAIRNVINRTKDPKRLRNFALSSYLNAQGKSQPEYRLTKDGFYFIAAGFTGPEADEWKWDFIDAFNAMEAALQAKTTRFAKALDQLRPCLRPVVEGTEAGRSRAEIAAPLDRSPAAVTYHRRVARRLGLLTAHRRGKSKESAMNPPNQTEWYAVVNGQRIVPSPELVERNRRMNEFLRAHPEYVRPPVEYVDATVHVAMPQGFALPALNHKGLPEFEVTPDEAREACNRLRLFADLEETISGGRHD